MNLDSLLHAYWGFESFRPLQREIVESVVSGRDTLAILPTGGGKSLCFQIAGLARGGVTIVVSPLIALMQDQVDHLSRMSLPAAYINSTLPPEEIERRLSLAERGTIRYLYLAPERLNHPTLIHRLPRLPIKLLAIDEAHCISQWGHDFRKAYLELSTFRERLPGVPTLALTATATPAVRNEIVQRLKLVNPQIFVQSFCRPNLRYSVLYEHNREEKMMEIIRNVGGSGIVYTRARKTAEELAEYISQRGISAVAYHAGLGTNARESAQNAWIDDRVQVVVATVAFGMGIDKSNVRFVIHYGMPQDLESYYQEAGRAGRDGRVAFPVLFYRPADKKMLFDTFFSRFPDKKTVEIVYETMCDDCGITRSAGVSADVFAPRTDLWAKKAGVSQDAVRVVLRWLADGGYIHYSDEGERHGWIKMIHTDEAILELRRRRPDYDHFFDGLLRYFGGRIFTESVRFETAILAGRLHLAPDQLFTKLNYLKNIQLLDFQPPLDEPGIRFLCPRQKINFELLGWDEIERRRKHEWTKLEQMVRYAERTDRCRSVMISEYFGEKGVQACGKCDNCLQRHVAHVDTALSKAIADEISDLLSVHGRLLVSDLVALVRRGNKSQAAKVVDRLVNEERLSVDDEGKVGLPPKRRRFRLR
jgi:ATP-dependent DNA helicase RecQ